MKAAVVRDYEITEFLGTTLNAVGLVNLIVLADGVAGADADIAAELSELEQCVVISSGLREDGDRLYYSAVVAENGAVLGGVDAVHSVRGLDTSETLGVFDLSYAKVGILAGDDVLYPEAARALVDAGAKFLVALRDTTSQAVIAMARSHAVANGVRLIYCARDCGFAADYNGKITQFNGRVVTVDCALLTHPNIKSGLKKDCCKVSFFARQV